MKAAQFVRGKIDGIQKRYETANLNDLLPQSKLNELKDYADVGEYPQFFKQKPSLIKTVVTAAPSTDGRRGGIINHTVIYQYDQTVTQDGIKYLFPLEDFITEVLSGKRRWKMPPLPELPATDSDFAIIDPPPPIEWEVQT